MDYVKRTDRLFKENKFDYEALRFSGEIEMEKVLEEDYALNNYYDIFDNESDVLETTNSMVANSVQLNSILAPRLYNICREISDYLEFHEKVDFYLASSHEVNAFSINGFGFAPHIICLTSSLVNMISDDELRFVIGHEIGHLIFEHSKLDIVYHIMSNRDDDEMNWLLYYNFTRWRKYAEISSDRIGYLVCPDPKVIGKLFFKFAAGLSEDVLNFDVDEYLKQMVRLKELAYGDFFATHPNNLVRIKSLNLLNESEFLRNKSQEKEYLTKDKLEDLVLEYMNTLELHPKKEIDKMVVEFISVVGYYVSNTFDGIPDSKMYMISELLCKYTSQPEKYLLIESFKELKTRVAKVCKFFADRHDGVKYVLLDQIVKFAISDGRMEKGEKEIIYEIGSKLKISEDEITRTIKRISEMYLSPKRRLLARRLKR